MGDTFTFGVNVGVQATFFHTLVGFYKLFAYLLRDAAKAALGMGSGFHQTVLSG
jgi:hypothetical protein